METDDGSSQPPVEEGRERRGRGRPRKEKRTTQTRGHRAERHNENIERNAPEIAREVRSPETEAIIKEESVASLADRVLQQAVVSSVMQGTMEKLDDMAFNARSRRAQEYARRMLIILASLNYVEQVDVD